MFVLCNRNGIESKRPRDTSSMAVDHLTSMHNPISVCHKFD